jgi:hypothetical protein
MTPLNWAMASDRPMTVPMKPRMGMARAVDVGLVGHHAGDFAVDLAGLEEFQRLADAVDHEAVPEFHGQRVNVLDEGPDIVLGNLAGDVLGQDVEAQGALLVADLEEFEREEGNAPAEEERLRELHPAAFISKCSGWRDQFPSTPRGRL